MVVVVVGKTVTWWAAVEMPSKCLRWDWCYFIFSFARYLVALVGLELAASRCKWQSSILA